MCRHMEIYDVSSDRYLPTWTLLSLNLIKVYRVFAFYSCLYVVNYSLDVEYRKFYTVLYIWVPVSYTHLDVYKRQVVKYVFGTIYSSIAV